MYLGVLPGNARRRALDPWELKLKMIVSPMWVLGIEPRALQE